MFIVFYIKAETHSRASSTYHLCLLSHIINNVLLKVWNNNQAEIKNKLKQRTLQPNNP